jgi:hypothetical protein
LPPRIGSCHKILAREFVTLWAVRLLQVVRLNVGAKSQDLLRLGPTPLTHVWQEQGHERPNVLSLVDTPRVARLPAFGSVRGRVMDVYVPESDDALKPFNDVAIGHANARLHLDLPSPADIGVPASFALEEASGPGDLYLVSLFVHRRRLLRCRGAGREHGAAPTVYLSISRA